MADKPCGLICLIPPSLQAEWAAKLSEFVKRFPPAAIILTAPHSTELVLAAKPFELAVLFHDDCHHAKVAGASGVYLSGALEEVTKARADLGSAAIIGAECDLSRHDAIEKAEAGADFVAFNSKEEANWAKAAELAEWWDEVTQVPLAIACAALANKVPPAYAFADFLIVEESHRAGESLTFATELGLQSEI